VSGTAAGWLSYYDPNGAANMARNAARISQPFLYVIGTADPLYAAGRGYVFSRAKANPKSRYLEIDAGHFDTPDRARADVVAWLKTL
jgi:pimeloyl-ACP methyl ester carboxylesterase